jgi:large subunit ribosomal protein L5
MKKTASKYQPRLLSLYNDTLIEQLKSELSLSNVHQVPKLEKVVINTGLGRMKDDKKYFETATNTLKKITGQQPISTYAKRSIATFKLREGNKIGLKVTLRGNYMYEFTDRFISLVLPRIRDFHGVSNHGFDKQGNYAIGLVDQSVFPELSFEETSPAHGLQIIFVIKAAGAEQSKMLLSKFGMPFAKENK